MDDDIVESANLANPSSEDPLASTAAAKEHAGIEDPPQPPATKKRPSKATSDGAEKKVFDKKSDLDKYLMDDREPNIIGKSFDALGWWKKAVERYSIVGLMARDVLAIPVSTVASESAFSTGGRVLNPFRSSLSSHMVEALICAQDWMRNTRGPLIIEESIDDIQQIEEELSSLVDPPLVPVVDDYF